MIRADDGGSREGELSNGGTDRGQLLLVGAVAIAIIFLALVVVFNTVLFTDSTSPTESLESAEEARSFEEQVRNDTRRIMYDVANETGAAPISPTPGGCSLSLATGSINNNWECYAADNISRYSLMMATSYADTGPVYVDVDVLDISMDSTELEAEIRVTYRTNDFSYTNTMVVTTSAP